jgi:hypothetical protein
VDVVTELPGANATRCSEMTVAIPVRIYRMADYGRQCHEVHDRCMARMLLVSNLRPARKGIVTRSSRVRGLKMTMNPRMPSQSDIAAKVGVLLYDTTVEVDAILTDTVQCVRARGIAVGGLLQRLGERLSSGKHSMWLDDIATGRTIRLDQPRGPGARACILDTDALAQAACLLRSATEAEHELIIVNRFGHAEANGGGMRAEIADAICSGAAVVIAVRPARLDGLEDFLGGPASLLQPSPEAITDWAERAVAIRQLTASSEPISSIAVAQEAA